MIKHIITAGLGNGTFSADVRRIVTRGLNTGGEVTPPATDKSLGLGRFKLLLSPGLVMKFTKK